MVAAYKRPLPAGLFRLHVRVVAGAELTILKAVHVGGEAMDPTSSSFDLNSDRAFQEKFWTFERVAWIFFALVVLAGLAGFTGRGGSFADATVSGPTGSIHYPRVTRWLTRDELRLALPPGTSGQAVVELDQGFSRIFEIEKIQPTPAESHATGEGQRLVFDLRPPDGRKELIFHVRGSQPLLGGRTWMRINGGPPLFFSSVVLP